MVMKLGGVDATFGLSPTSARALQTPNLQPADAPDFSWERRGWG